MTVDDDPAPGNRREVGKGQFIPMRQAWLEQVATDREVTPMALRVAMLLSNGFNQKTLETFISRETMATKLNVRPGIISTGVASLKARGHVSVRTVKRNNHYLMVLKDPSDDASAMAIGTNSDTSQVREFEPNRYENSYTNRQVTGPEQGSGANAPASHEQDSTYSETYRDEEDTHAPEGARPISDSEEDEANMTHDEALDQLAKAFGGPVGDRTVAMVCMHRALDEGLFHDQLIHAALHPASDDLTLEDLLHHQTQAGRRNRAAV